MNITEEQLDKLRTLSDKIEFHTEQLSDIASEDKPTINIGFNLGVIHTEILDSYYKIHHILNDINTQNRKSETVGFINDSPIEMPNGTIAYTEEQLSNMLK